MQPRLILGLIVMLTLFGVWVNVPKFPQIPEIIGVGKFPLKLGLDLQGGTELVLAATMNKIEPESRDEALESAKRVIERRVNFYGVSEATVQTSKVGDERRILVEMPGIQDTQAAVDLVGKTAQLDFRELLSSPSAEASESGRINYLSITKPTGLTGADLKKTQVTFDSSRAGSGPQVLIEFSEAGKSKFAEVTKRNIGKPLAMFLDEEPLLWPPPIVQTEIVAGSAVISGNFSLEEAKNLSIQLNAGALPVPITILQQRSIGATLGAESVQKSFLAGGIGLLTIMIFMVAYYGIYGLIANIALVVYTLLVLAIFRTGLFIIPPVTLTLAGIAGVILSIGMAVDANILTFERIKEEERLGKKGSIALEQGFRRAWTSIRDSNSSSLITAFILYLFGTSVVRGFALTLTIGILVSMFSAIIVSRNLLRMLPRFKN
ncbi:MAG: protein translocase subunit SecD [Candidatus Daviesbacteria bacterium]|nr:protein translocase subunit SecD [Candidatus Daviesbacteria bacterium]